MDILYNDSIPLSLWQEFLSVNPNATPFQSPEFYNLFNSVKTLSAEAIAIADSETIKALVVITLQKEPGIKGFFSRRAIVYGGPLIDDDYPEALEMLLKQILTFLNSKTIYIEIRNFSDYANYKEIFIQHGYNYTPWLNFKLATRDFKSMSAAVSDSRMRQIKKAKKNLVTWKEAQNMEDVMLFYDILARLYRHKIHKPLLPVDFFRNFFETGFGKYFLVCYKNKIIGGIMCPLMEEKVIYEFYVCGLDDEFKEQHPSIMSTWAAMEYANQNNIPVFNLMGAGTPDEQYGVRDFKARFGGELVEYGRFIRINKPLLYELGKFVIKLKTIIN